MAFCIWILIGREHCMKVIKGGIERKKKKMIE